VTATDISIDLEQITDAAGAVAEAFGLGQQAGPLEDWEVDDGDQVIGAVVHGDDPFCLYLAVNASIGARLLNDRDRLAAGLTEAARALVGRSASFTVEDIELTTGRPEAFAGIFDQGQLSAIFGIASMEAAARSAAGVGAAATAATAATAAADTFEPQALAMSDNQFLVNAGALELLSDVEMEVTVELGRTSMPIRELLSLQPGMVVEIDRAAGAPIDVLVNGRRIASGEVVVIDEEFGVRITEIVAVGDR
jgi:flagellar motor switch protein FliN/FliY